MLALLAGFVATFYLEMPRHTRFPVTVRDLPVRISLPDASTVAASAKKWEATDILPWLAPVWLVGAFLFQMHCLASWLAAGRLRRAGVYRAADAWVQTLERLKERLQISKTVTLLESCCAEIPVVIGHLRPVILMPAGLLAGLPPEQIESILLHELAHIRRMDYLVNLIQTIVEGLLFYHPAVWWISSAIRTERENCCDDLVVETNGDAHGYATALAALAQNRWGAHEAALAATGGNLGKRIRRLLSQPELPRTTVAPVLAAGILIVSSALLLSAWQSPIEKAPAALLAGPQTPSLMSQPLMIAQAQAQTRTAPPANSDVEDPYRKWLNEEVPYIITDQERSTFKSLSTNSDRAAFIGQFWLRRDPTPGTPRNEFREEHYRRIKYANERFASRIPGWKTDRGRIYIQYGPPDEIESHPSGSYVRPPEQGGGTTANFPFEQWLYRRIEGIGENVIIDFVDRDMNGEYRMTMDPNVKNRPEAQEQVEQQADQLQRQVLERQAEMARSMEQLRALQAELQDRQVSMENVRTSTEEVARKLQEQARDVQTIREMTEKVGGGKIDHRVFLSTGNGTQAAVIITGSHKLMMTVPLDFDASEFLVEESVTDADGKAVWSNTSKTVSPCRKPNDKGGCLNTTLHLSQINAPSLGSYTFTAQVRDASGATKKSYMVNFSVN
jgi:GWxTD domain-containing protein